MSDFQIRPVSKEEFAIAVGWAADEGWNPGLDDLDAFHGIDPSGFLMGWIDDQPVASISVVNYSQDYGFLGFYIVHPDQRGRGSGMAIWNAGMKHLGERTIGLDGVVDQQENYQKSGFVYSGRNIRFSGVPDMRSGRKHQSTIRDFAPSDINDLLDYDHRFFPVARDNFVRAWTDFGKFPRRRTKIAVIDQQLAGYGTIRQCRSGYKIGPLFAGNTKLARGLFEQLCCDIPKNSEISLDVPEANSAACSMAGDYGLQPVFETARMYRGSIASLPVLEIFGITTFELG